MNTVARRFGTDDRRTLLSTGLLLASLMGEVSTSAAPPCIPLPPPKYSFDRMSPSVGDGTVNSDSILIPGEAAAIELLGGDGIGLGMAGDDLDALSPAYFAVPDAASFALLFSVDRDTVGGVPPDPQLVALGIPHNVRDQALVPPDYLVPKGQAAGDQFMSLRLFTRQGLQAPIPPDPGLNNNVLICNNWDEGGPPPPPPCHFFARPPISAGDVNPGPAQDNVDALGNFPSDTITLLFFSVDSMSPSTPTASGADIFVDFSPTTAGDEMLFLSAADMGLMVEDDIDGLIVFDDDADGIADAGDQVLFTLRPGSPSLGTQLSSADVLSFTYNPFVPTAATLYAAHADLGLAFADAIDALELLFCVNPIACAVQHGIRVSPCGEPIPAVSQGGGVITALLIVGAAVIVFARRWPGRVPR